MPSVLEQISAFPIPVRKPTNTTFTGEQGVEAMLNARRLQSTQPPATVQTLALALNVAASYMHVGELIQTREKYADTGIGGDTYWLQDAGSANARPPEKANDIYHVGAAGLYLQAVGLGTANDIVYSVGDNADYSSLNELLSDIYRQGRGYFGDNPIVTVSLEAGYQLDEQVVCDGIDLSFVRLQSADAQVPIVRSALTTLNIPNLDYNSAPTFLAANGGKLPMINALFSMDTSGTATNRHGVMCAWGGASVVVGYGCGVINAGSRGFYLVGGIGYARNSVWDGAGTRCIRGGNGSLLNIRGASAQNGGEYNLALGGGTVATATGINVSNGLGTNVLIDNGAILNADGIICNNAAVNGMDMKFAATFNGYGGDFSGAAVRALDIISSHAELENANCGGAGSTAVVINKASVVNLQGATVQSLGNTVGLSCTASKVNFKNGVASSTGGQPIRVFDGGEITAQNATGGMNVTPNTITANGIIYQ